MWAPAELLEGLPMPSGSEQPFSNKRGRRRAMELDDVAGEDGVTAQTCSLRQVGHVAYPSGTTWHSPAKIVSECMVGGHYIGLKSIEE